MATFLYFILVALAAVHLVRAQPENERCSSATSLPIGATVSGTNVGSIIQTEIPFCASRGTLSSTEDVAAPSAWYSIVGKGEGIRAYSCAGSNATGINRAVMAVYRDGCDSLRCSSVSVPEEEEGYCADDVNGEVISWFGMEGVTYHLLVRGINAQLQGAFELHVKRLESLSPHDVCWNALSVKVSDERIMDLIGGDKTTIDFRALGCSASGRNLADTFNFQISTGLWYLLEGTGGTLRAAPPCGGVEFSIRVYTGDCTGLVCTGRRTRQNVCGSEWGDENVVIFETELGKQYYIYVESLSSSTINAVEFDLLLSEGSSSPEVLFRSSVLLLAAFSTFSLLL